MWTGLHFTRTALYLPLKGQNFYHEKLGSVTIVFLTSHQNFYLREKLTQNCSSKETNIAFFFFLFPHHITMQNSQLSKIPKTSLTRKLLFRMACYNTSDCINYAFELQKKKKPVEICYLERCKTLGVTTSKIVTQM